MERREASQVGMVIGDRYSVVAPLARGGFGTVYEAEQITTERRVALKLVARQPGLDSTEYMLGEARLASRLQSEHIVQVIDAGIDHASGSVFVVMDLLAGSTLADVMEERSRFDAATVVEYVRQVCSGLEKAHTHVDRDGNLAPIVHRDLKPANIFVTRRDNGAPLLKILDFGTAKMLSSRAISSRIVRGTPQYMAPEQLAGERPTPATDIWSLGLMTFELLTGRSYWLAVARDAPYEALFNELNALPFVPASQRARELGEDVALPPAFDAWFARCVQRDPALRLASARLAAEELARALSGNISFETNAMPEAGGPGTVAIAGVPTPAPAPVPAPRRAPGAFDATTSATWLPQRRRRSRALLVGIVLGALGVGGVAWYAARSRHDEPVNTAERATPAPTETASAATPSVDHRVTAHEPAAPEPTPSAAEPPAAATTTAVKSAPTALRPVKARKVSPRASSDAAPKSSKDAKPNLYQLR